MKRRALALIALLLVLGLGSGCGIAGIPVPGGGPAELVPIPSDAADQPTPSFPPRDPEYPAPSRAFRTHFTDGLYYDLAEEFSPFGNDEGFDELFTLQDRRDELDRCTTVRELYGDEAADEADTNGPDVDGFLIGDGFALILLTGHIDTEGKTLVLAALHRSYSFYARDTPREYAVMYRDLAAFPATDCGS